MEDQWEWLSGHRLQGPITTAELEFLISRKRIADSDRIRPVGTEEWLPATQIKTLFEERTGSTAKAASDVLANASRHLLHREVGSVERSRRRGPGLLQRLLGSFGGLGERLADVIGLMLGALSFLKVLVTRQGLLAMLIVALVVIVARNVDFGESPEKQLFDRMSEASTRLQGMDDREAGDLERSQFRAETQSWLQPELAKLEKSIRQRPIVSSPLFSPAKTSSENELQRDLVMAGRSLAAILEENGPPEKHRVIFRDHLTNASYYFNGPPPPPPSAFGQRTRPPVVPIGSD